MIGIDGVCLPRLAVAPALAALAMVLAFLIDSPPQPI